MRQYLLATVLLSLFVGSFSIAFGESEFEVSYNEESYICTVKGATFLVSISNNGRELLLTRRIKVLKKQLQKATGQKKAKIGKQIRVLAKLNRMVVKVCKQTSSSLFTPTPGSTLTPSTPTPTVVPTTGGNVGEGNFDNDGNVTSTGKALFGIPDSLSANVSRGKLVHDQQCVGCHAPKTNKSFSYLRTEIAKSPMFIDTTRMPDATLADLTAYINRFRT
jgi:hypothetical protein